MILPREDFEQIVIDELGKVPERFLHKTKNVAFLVEDNVSEDTRMESGLRDDEELLGHYQGVPLVSRGDDYGIGMVLPDVITIYQDTTERQAGGDLDKIRTVVRETIFHEVAHYLGMDESAVREWEAVQPEDLSKI